MTLFRGVTAAVGLLLSVISIARDDLDYFLMDIQADGFVLAESLTTYPYGEHYLVDFELFLEAVEFPISRDGELWSGWFRTEDRHFIWHTEAETLEIDGETGISPDGLSWMENEEGIFVSTRILEIWFDLRLLVNTQLQTITVSSSDPLPFQKWKQQTLAKYRYRAAPIIESDIIVADQYHWATLPMFDLSSSSLIQSQSGERNTAQSAALMMGMDLLKHSIVYSGGINQSSNSGFNGSNRMTIKRAAATADTTLAFGVSRYSLGDVLTVNPNLVVGAGSGLGFSVERNADGRLGNLNRATIAGDAPPGWEVELYRNGVLIEFATVDTAGRYLFADQETPYGENIFLVKMFGPQGQTLEDRHTYWGGGTDLSKGDYNFSVSHIEFDRSLLDGKSGEQNGLAGSNTTDFRYSHGITDTIQLGGGYTRVGMAPGADGGTFADAGYLSLFGRMKLGRGVFIAEAANQLQSGMAWNLEYLTIRNGHNISVAHRFVGDFESPSTIRNNDMGVQNQLTLSGRMGPDKLAGYTLRLTHRNRADGTTDFRLFNRLGLIWGPLSIGNDLEYFRGPDDDVVSGQLKIAGRVSRFGLRGQLSYQLSEGRPLKQISGSVNWSMGERFNNNLVISRNLTGDRSLRFQNIFSARIRDFDVSLNLSTNVDDAWAVGLGFNIHFGYDGRQQGFITDKRSLASTGRVAMNLFVDDNNNGIRDPGEEAVRWVSYKEEPMLSEGSGTVLLDALPHNRAVQLETRHFKFDDPFLVPRSDVYEFYTHAGGDISVDIAVVLTGDIEGYVVSGPNGTKGVRGVVVMLYDSKGKKIATTRSDFEGFYTFAAVPGGDYEIRVEQESGFSVFAKPFSFDSQDGYVVLDGIYLYQ